MRRFQYSLRTLIIATLVAAAALYFANLWNEARLRAQREERLGLVLEQFGLKGLNTWIQSGGTLVPKPVVTKTEQGWAVDYTLDIEVDIGLPQIHREKFAALRVDCVRSGPFSVLIEVTEGDDENGLTQHLVPYFHVNNWAYVVKRVKGSAGKGSAK